eukprot:363828-Chlamydomonas_euryale.AAC.3
MRRTPRRSRGDAPAHGEPFLRRAAAADGAAAAGQGQLRGPGGSVCGAGEGVEKVYGGRDQACKEEVWGRTGMRVLRGGGWACACGAGGGVGEKCEDVRENWMDGTKWVGGWNGMGGWVSGWNKWVGGWNGWVDGMEWRHGGRPDGQAADL